jgi:hypothetical protein
MAAAVGIVAIVCILGGLLCSCGDSKSSTSTDLTVSGVYYINEGERTCTIEGEDSTVDLEGYVVYVSQGGGVADAAGCKGPIDTENMTSCDGVSYSMDWFSQYRYNSSGKQKYDLSEDGTIILKIELNDDIDIMVPYSFDEVIDTIPCYYELSATRFGFSKGS